MDEIKPVSSELLEIKSQDKHNLIAVFGIIWTPRKLTKGLKQNFSF